jgi:SAM-dependent MidA family methyltransferase
LIRIITLLEEIKEFQKVQNGNMQAMFRVLKCANEVPTLPADVSFPLTDMESFDAMEVKLLEDATFFNALVRFNYL